MVPVAAAGNRRSAPVTVMMEVRDGWRDKHIADSSDKLHGGRGAKEETSVLVLGERHQGEGALAAARAAPVTAPMSAVLVLLEALKVCTT